MNKYRVRMAVYAPQRYAKWIIREEVEHEIRQLATPRNVSITSWEFTHITSGSNSCFQVEFKVRCLTKSYAKKLARKVTNTSCLHQAYIRSTEEIPARSKTIEINIRACTVPGAPTWEVVLSGMLDTYEYNNHRKLERYFRERERHFDTPTLVSSEWAYVASSSKRWFITARVAAHSEMDAAGKAHSFFNTSIWKELDVCSVTKYDPAQPLEYAHQRLHELSRYDELELWNFEVKVEVQRERGYAEERASAILACSNIEDWEVTDSRSMHGLTRMAFWIRIRAKTKAIAQRTILACLTNESYIEDYSIRYTGKPSPPCAPGLSFDLKDDTIIQVTEVDPDGRVHCSIQYGNTKYYIEFKTKNDFETYVETRGIT